MRNKTLFKSQEIISDPMFCRQLLKVLPQEAIDLLNAKFTKQPDEDPGRAFSTEMPLEANCAELIIRHSHSRGDSLTQLAIKTEKMVTCLVSRNSDAVIYALDGVQNCIASCEFQAGEGVKAGEIKRHRRDKPLTPDEFERAKGILIGMPQGMKKFKIKKDNNKEDKGAGGDSPMMPKDDNETDQGATGGDSPILCRQ